MSNPKRQPAHRRVLPVLQEVDKYMERNLKLVGDVSCAKGCSSCCELLVMMTSGEAELLAEAIVSRLGIAEAQEILAKTEAQVDLLDGFERKFGIDEAGDRRSRYAWWHARQTCVLLDEATRTCRLYDVRPGPCRTYYVVSDAERCGERGKDGAVVKTLQLTLPHEVQLEFLRRTCVATEDAGLEVLLGSMPQLMSLALRRRLGMPKRPSLGGASILSAQ